MSSPITITALVIFAVTYILMMAFQKIRPYVAIGSAVVFVILGTVAAINPAIFGAEFFTLANGSSFTYSVMSALKEID